MKTNKIASLALLGALSFGVTVPAFAQSTSTAPNTSATASTVDPRADHAARQDAAATDLATRLGISKDKVIAAFTAQASLPPARPATKPTAAERKAASAARLSSFATTLGVSSDALTKALADIQKARVDTMAADGFLTPAQVSARKALIDADTAAGDVGGFGGPGGHGRGGFEGGGFDRGGRGGGFR